MTEERSLDWARAFALLIPLNEPSDGALRTRRNRRQRAKASRYDSCMTERNTRCLARLNFKMLLGRRCATIGASRSSIINLPRDQGVCMTHLYLHFHPESMALLLTDTSVSGTHVQVVGGEPVLLRHQTVQISGRTRIWAGNHRQFGFDIKPTLRWEGFDRLLSRWLRSVEPRLGSVVPRHGQATRRNESPGWQRYGLPSPPPESPIRHETRAAIERAQRTVPPQPEKQQASSEAGHEGSQDDGPGSGVGDLSATKYTGSGTRR